jgi:hypothetical protein
MGHIRLGRLPRTIRWLAVIEELESPQGSPTSIANKTLHAATRVLSGAPDERGCYFPLLALSRLIVAAKSADTFEEELNRLGVEAEDREDGLRLLEAVQSAALQPAKDPKQKRTTLSDISERAYRETLASRVRATAGTLWGMTPEDVRLTLRSQGTERNYNDLTREWFGRFVGRCLQSFVDRELSNHVGSGVAATSADAVRIERELMAYARERTQIIEEYAPAWLSKTLYVEGGLEERAAQRFFRHAISKILADIRIEPKQK